MRLGATIGDYLGTEDPTAHVAECRRQGYRAAPCPEVAFDDRGRIRDIKRAFGDADNRTLYITSRTSVYRVRMTTPGCPVPLR